MSSFSELIFQRTYAFSESEDWEGCAARVAKFVANGHHLLEVKFFDAIRTKKFIPGGRYLYASGRKIPQLNNCLAGETEVITSEGVLPIRDIVGTRTLLTVKNNGNTPQWVEAEVRSFGVQWLYKVVFERCGVSKELYATADHKWLVRVNGDHSSKIHEVPTTELMEKDYKTVVTLAPKYKHKSHSPVGIQHGIWYGDGTKSSLEHCKNALLLVSPKNDALVEYFTGYQTSTHERGTLVYGGPNYFKDLPPLTETKDYLLSWLAGYFAADGCVAEDGKVQIGSTKKQNVLFVRDVCSILGIGTYSINSRTFVSNLTNEETTYWYINLFGQSLDEDFFLLPEHRARFVKPERTKGYYTWRVKEVAVTDRYEEVYCAVVPETQNFVLADQIVTHNCFLMRAEDSREGWANLIQKHMLALSTGGGVGTEYCLDPKTKVLKTDLTWVELNTIQPGDELIGFDENLGLDKTKLKPSKVLSVSKITRPSYRVVTDRGEVVASAEHRWKARDGSRKRHTRKGEGYGWIATDKLKPGDKIAFAEGPWEVRTGFDAGWMSGLLDGEGWVSRAGGGVAQNEGLVLERIKALFNRDGIRYTESTNKRGKIPTKILNFSGKWAKLKALGMYRPVRLLPKARDQWTKLKVGGKNNPPAVVFSVEYLGEQEVIGVGTETKTLIANGFFSHNSQIRPKGAEIKGFGGVASGPIALMCMVNEVARYVMAGGKRRSALWAGLNWQHPDVEEFLVAKNWSTQIKALKEADFNFPAPLDMTNISVGLDEEFFRLVVNKKQTSVWDRYYRICKSMCKTGEPGFSINIGRDRDNVLRNPCTEVVSHLDSDVCNLGSINLSKIRDLQELEEITRIAVKFLYCGTFLSWLPHIDFELVREKHRRIGLGLMGLHEWCIKHDQPYAPNDKLALWLDTWQQVSNDEAKMAPYSTAHSEGVEPIAVRAIAPTGTIGIIGETTTGIEPIFCVAYKRRFLDSNGRWKYSYVVDPTAERLIQEGIKPESIEDAYQLSHDVERRIAMQAFVQGYVDQGISSTINVPSWGESGNNNAKAFAETLLKYLPRLRGITVYPEGSRPGQPITPIPYDQAVKHKDVVFEESSERCSGGVCGI